MDEADALNSDGPPASRSSLSSSFTSSAISSPTLPTSSYGAALPHEGITARVSSDAEAEAKVIGVTAGVAFQSRPGIPSFAATATTTGAAAAASDASASAAATPGTAAAAENPFAFRARTRLLAPNTLLHPPGVFSSCSAASGGASGSSRRRFSSFSSGRQCCSSSSSTVKSSCTTFGRPDPGSLLLLLPPPQPAAAPSVAAQSSSTDGSSCTTTCNSSETESSRSTLDGSPALSFSMPATPRLHFRQYPGQAQKPPPAYAACNVSPFTAPAVAAAAAAAAAAPPPAGGGQTKLGLFAFSLPPRAFLSESSAAARAWPAKRRRSIHVDGSSTGMLLPEQQQQQQQMQVQQEQGAYCTVFAAGGRQQEDLGLRQQQNISSSSGDARPGPGSRGGCSKNSDSRSNSGAECVMGQEQQEMQTVEFSSGGVVDSEAPAAFFTPFPAAAAAGEDFFRVVVQQREKARREAGGMKREEEKEGEMRAASFLQPYEEAQHAEKETISLCHFAASSDSCSNSESRRLSSGPPSDGVSPSTRHASPVSSAVSSVPAPAACPSDAPGAAGATAAAAEGKGARRLEFLDSGCYSLCYHTAMAVVPYTALSTDSAVAQLLQQQQTLLLDRDREARRRRKACLSVLRSVENAFVASPRLDSQPSAAARRCVSPAGACHHSAAAASPHPASDAAPGTAVLLPPAESFSSAKGGHTESSTDGTYSSAGGAAAASAGLQQETQSEAAGGHTAVPTNTGVEKRGSTTAVPDWGTAGPLHSFAAPSSSPYFSFSAPPSSVTEQQQIPMMQQQQQLFSSSSICCGQGNQKPQHWGTAVDADFSGRTSATSAGRGAAAAADGAFAASLSAFAVAGGETGGSGSKSETATSLEQKHTVEGVRFSAGVCASQQSPRLRCPDDELSEDEQQQRGASTAGGALTASSSSSTLLRLRPEWLSPYTLATLIGACIHCYDVLRAAYPPPEPPPRLCLLSLPALYTQLPPHLLAGTVLLDEAALTLGSPPQCLPLECSVVISPPAVQQRPAPVGRSGGSGSNSSSSSDSSSSSGMETDATMRTRDKQGENRDINALPGNLLGQFDIIVCETRSVTLASIENIAACVKALSRRRRKKRCAGQKKGIRIGTAGVAGAPQQSSACAGAGGSMDAAGFSRGALNEEVYMECNTRGGDQPEGGLLEEEEEEEEIDAAVAALGSLSLFKPGEDASTAMPEKQLEEQLQHQLQQQEAFQRLPSSVRVIMLSTCLLSAVVDDLLGLKQSRFQPYVPSSALSSLQLQCIYTNFDDYPPFQKHNDVDFATRVRARRRAAHCWKGRRRAGGFEGCGSSQNSSDNSSITNREAGLLERGEHGRDILLRDPLISRAMVLQAEEEARAALHTSEGAGEAALHSATNGESSSDESGAEELDDADELATGRARPEPEGKPRQPCQRTAEAALLNAFEALQLQSCGLATVAATVSPQQRLLQQQQGKVQNSAASAFSTGSSCGLDRVGQSTAYDHPQPGTGEADTENNPRLLMGNYYAERKEASSTAERVRNVQRSRACRGITMRQGDEDDGIDYDIECGSHFGMVPHEL